MVSQLYFPLISTALIILIYSQNVVKGVSMIRWCSMDRAEHAKCLELATQVTRVNELVSNYKLECVGSNGVFNCMKMIDRDQADIASFDVGIGYYGAEKYALRPIVVENYAASNKDGQRDLHYASVAMVRKGSGITPFNLEKRGMCFSGVGTGAGWIAPLSKLITELRAIPVTKCNSLIQSMGDFIGESCAPGALAEVFNIFGDNDAKSCRLCANQADPWSFCSYRDFYAGDRGALRCLNATGSIAFLRALEWQSMPPEEFNPELFELMCPNKQANGGYTAPLSNWTSCNWGSVQSRMVMTKMTREDIPIYTKFLAALVPLFGPQGTKKNLFELFATGNLTEPPNAIGRMRRDHLMFSDYTQNLYVPEQQKTNTYYQWIDPSFQKAIQQIHSCPQPDIRWCVISQADMNKCARMKNALDAKSIRPEFNCIMGGSTVDCMRLIEQGYADLITLDAGDLYSGGKYFGLVPIAAEFYGDSSNYYAVAIAKRPDLYLTIANMKYRRTCHSGVGKATGWVIPLNLVLETGQIRVYYGHLIHAFSELVSRSCVPGILNSEYNPTTFNSLNLCEICSSGGDDKCQRDTRDLYFGDTGAFRCLVEGGDVAFARHTTVRENTGGRNPVDWARNRRSDDYELLCPDGSRAPVTQWRTCNLGEIPGATVVTAGFKTAQQRENLWRLLRYAQEYYSSDDDPVFSMFASDFGKSDLMFTDSAVALRWIPQDQQSYTAWLGRTFLRQVENLEHISAPGESGIYNTASRGGMMGRLSTVIISIVMVITGRVLLY